VLHLQPIVVVVRPPLPIAAAVVAPMVAAAGLSRPVMPLAVSFPTVAMLPAEWLLMVAVVVARRL